MEKHCKQVILASLGKTEYIKMLSSNHTGTRAVLCTKKKSSKNYSPSCINRMSLSWCLMQAILLTQLSLRSQVLCLASPKAPATPVYAAAQVQESGHGDGSFAVFTPALLPEPV